MKTTNSNLQLLAVLLSIVLVFQSCKVYHSETATIEDASRFTDNIKVVSATNEIYKFESLQKEEGEIYGIVDENSKTAKKLSNQIVEIIYPEGWVKIHLLEENIKEIYLQNRTMSTVGNVSIVIGALLGLILSFISVNNDIDDIRNWAYAQLFYSL
ncbi:MAG: hypothetical protein MUP24_06825 [Gillisia sp.]|nr:hypothetical protein [Gillisia sp.]